MPNGDFMTSCPSCKYSIESDTLKCPNCGLLFEETSGPTAYFQDKSDRPSSHSAESTDGARFTAGTILADRYRIIGLLGRGGMGEVYKAEDLKLKQVVALKFLPDAVAMDGAALSRFQNEVRITRQISHPNVCRVYDIGEADGSHFLSMEFIDGEDLSLLLRRIGRLPGDKANEIARQICAGLAAAHENGVLHRDLKPANIMIDGRGKARVTDFGVAVVAKELMGREAASGTAQYMAPEQLKGQEVTQKSDIYSLGLVLYELFTGKKVYDSDNIHELMRLHESSSPTSPSSHVEHIDPLVERVIMRCLEKEPNRRPATAIQVAAALPGGDPLAAALAAGETPSPEMVAASGEKVGLRPAVAVGLLAAIVIGLTALALVGNKVNWSAQILRKNSVDALRHKAEDVIQRLGYTDPPTDSASGFSTDFSYKQYVQQNSQAADRWSEYTKTQPAAIYFWYRSSPRLLSSLCVCTFGWISETDPPTNDVSGMVSVKLDPSGRMTAFSALPPQVDTPGEKPPPPDWAPLFVAAGLDIGSFTPTESTWMPEPGFDARAAWTGTYPDQPDVPIRIEAAAYHGKPVSFFIVQPWTKPKKVEENQQTAAQNASTAIVLTLVIGLLVGAMLLVRKNLRQGRGDRRGAARLALFVLFIGLVGWALGAHHVLAIDEVANFFFVAASQTLLLAGLVWVFYIALEPYVRRRWPETIITWSRVLAGSFKDPLVGRDVLIAVLAGIVFSLLFKFADLARMLTGLVPYQSVQTDVLLGVRQYVAVGYLSNLNSNIFFSLFVFFMIFLLRILTRRRWLTAVLFVLIFSIIEILGQGDPIVAVPLSILSYGLMVFICLRFGLLPFVVSGVVGIVQNVPLSTDLSAWYTGYAIAALVFVLILAGWAFHTSLGGQKLISGSLLED